MIRKKSSRIGVVDVYRQGGNGEQMLEEVVVDVGREMSVVVKEGVRG